MVFRVFPRWLGQFALLGFALALFVPPVSARANDLTQAGHVLNRIGYGPSPTDLAYVQTIGVEAYIN